MAWQRACLPRERPTHQACTKGCPMHTLALLAYEVEMKGSHTHPQGLSHNTPGTGLNACRGLARPPGLQSLGAAQGFMPQRHSRQWELVPVWVPSGQVS